MSIFQMKWVVSQEFVKKKIHNMLRRGCKVDLQKRPLRQEVIRS